MRRSKFHRWALLAALCLGLTLMPRDAFAYIDPGSGSMAYQVVLTGILAGMFAVRRVLAWFTRRFASRNHSATPLDDSHRSA